MLLLEKVIAESNEKADELAKQGAMLDEGFMAQARATTIQQERKEVYAAMQHAASFHCPVEEWCEEPKPKSKKRVDFRGQEMGGNAASDRVVRHS